MKHKKMICIIVNFILIIIILFFISFHVKFSSQNENNNHILEIALVYRNTCYSWGDMDYLYIIKEDGSIYYENLVEHAEQYEDIENTFSIVMSVIGNEDKIEWQRDSFSEEIKNKLYDINYENIAFSIEKNDTVDRASEWYYCLLRTTEEYKLIKLKEIDRNVFLPKNKNVNDICEYVQSIIDSK